MQQAFTIPRRSAAATYCHNGWTESARRLTEIVQGLRKQKATQVTSRTASNGQFGLRQLARLSLAVTLPRRYFLVRGPRRSNALCLTFDDAYRDTLRLAYPVLKDAGVPFAIYVPTSFPDRLGDLWWLALEAVIARNNRIGLTIDGRDRKFDCYTLAEKQSLYHELYWWLRARPTEKEMLAIVHSLADYYQVDVAAFCGELCMNWPEIAQLAADPLVTIGAHTVNHPMLAKLPKETARSEMDLSRSVIEAALAVRPQHLSYPIGDRSSAGAREFEIAKELGFKTAVTTRPGVLFRRHQQHMTALPRISLNGEYQRLRYLKVLLSGSATAMWNGFKRLDAA